MDSVTVEALSRERILACAVRVADRDGLDGASLRKVAGELGVHVTSLYNHVPTKDALLDGVVEELFAGADLPVGEVTWERWVRAFVDGVAAMARNHPGAFAVLLRRPVQGPGASATFESGLAAFHRAGMDARGAYAAVKSVALAVLGCCVEQAGLATGEDLSTDVASLSADTFPMLHSITEASNEVDVVAALREVLVAGLAQQVAAVG
jgi:AcrR family transcriptional regulator